tara:strand:+ start:365 stop:745 length:381 start_codon:yes stop_codon:yes gene_type:complete
MSTISKVLLSACTQGIPIEIDATDTGGTNYSGSTAQPIHTAVSGATDLDEVWLWASNNSSTQSVLLTIEWGGVADPANTIRALINPNETQLVAPGWLLQNGLFIRAFASATNTITIVGYANRMDVS